MSDSIKNLPESREPMTREEANMMREIFQAGQASVSNNNYSLLAYGTLFFVLSLPFTDKIIRGFVDTTDLILIALKSVLFIMIIFVAQLLGL